MKPDLQNHIEALRTYAEQGVIEKAGLEALKTKRQQLEGLRKFISSQERQGIPITEGVMQDKRRLEATVDVLTRDSGTEEVYEALLDIVAQLGRKCQRHPQRDLRSIVREWESNTTSAEVLREEIKRILQEAGGSASEGDVMRLIEERLKRHFTKSDLERPKGKLTRWQNNVRSERRRMIMEGILTRRSVGRTWTLVTYNKKPNN